MTRPASLFVRLACPRCRSVIPFHPSEILASRPLFCPGCRTEFEPPPAQVRAALKD